MPPPTPSNYTAERLHGLAERLREEAAKLDTWANELRKLREQGVEEVTVQQAGPVELAAKPNNRTVWVKLKTFRRSLEDAVEAATAMIESANGSG